MTIVNSQQELVSAVAAGETDIRLGSDFTLAAQISVNQSFTLSSNGDVPFTITKADGYYGTLFRILGGTLTLRNVIIDGAKDSHEQENTAARCMVLVSGGTLILQNAALQNNNSYSDGGAVYLLGDAAYSNGLVIEDGSRISGCYSRTNGGGIMAAIRSNGDSVTFSGEVLIENNRAAYGAGLYMRSYVEGAASRLILPSGAVFSGNAATAYGGGVNFSGFRGESAAVSQLNVNGAEFNGNTAKHGGGVYFYGAALGDALQTDSAVFSSNHADGGFGGGVYLNTTEPSDLSIRNCDFNQNTANNGGGFAVQSAGCKAQITDSVLNGNASTGSGGGAWILNTSSSSGLNLIFSGGSFTENTGYAGGAAYITAGSYAYDLSLNGTSFVQNVAVGAGGAIAFDADADGEFSADAAVFSENSAGQSGGAVYFANGGKSARASFNGVQITDNTAAFEGGGLRLMAGRGLIETTVSDCVITGNTASGSSGGGIWNGGDNNLLTIDGGTQINNNSTLGGNGGGIYFNSDEGSVTVKDSVRVLRNSAGGQQAGLGNNGGGICLVPGTLYLQDEAEIAYNTARTFGGGISAAEQSSVFMTGGKVYNNQSYVAGGGLYVGGGSTANLSGGAVYANSAVYGGAAYNTGGGTLNVTAASAIGVDEPNVASGFASGIYNDSVLNIEGNRDLANGVYIENRESVVRLTSSLEESSTIQIDNTPYVAPNSDGIPVVVAQATDSYPVLSQTDADAFIKPPKDFDGWEIRLYEEDAQIVLAPIVYPIHYENLFESSQPNSEFYTVVTPDIVLYPPSERYGYIFSGWVDESGTPIAVIPSGSTGERTLYAMWKQAAIVLTYDGNAILGAPVFNVPPSQAFYHGADVTVSLQIPTRQGFIFSGWNTSADGGGTTYLSGELIPAVAADLTLYAIWQAVPAKSYTVRYSANDCRCAPAADVPAVQTFTEGEQIRLSDLTPKRNCYVFCGWSQDPCACAAQYAQGQEIGAAVRDIVLYTVWYCPPVTCR